MVEATLVVPAVRGRDINPYSAEPSLYVLVAHEPDRRSRPLSAQQLRDDFPGARRFLNWFKNKLLARRPYMSFRPTEECWWQLQGTDHMDHGYLVCISEIANPPSAAVFSSRWDEGLRRTVLPMPDHKATFFNTENADEAFFLSCDDQQPTIADPDDPVRELRGGFAGNTPLSSDPRIRSSRRAVFKACRAFEAGA